MNDADVVQLSRARQLAASGYARRIRQGADISLRELARQVGVAPATLHRWERGERRPTGLAAVRFVEVLDRLVAGAA